VTQYDDDADRLGETDPPPVTCYLCGVADLHWRSVTQADGRGEKSVLFTERGRKHVCPPPNADDFGTVA
jgi:hypothetical protein